MVDERLQALADEALATAREVAAEQELLTPVLIFEDESGNVWRILIKVPDVHPSEVMKVLLFAHRAVRAAICFEAYIVMKEPPKGQEGDWERAALAGRSLPGVGRPSRHPDRQDCLTLIAQGSERPAEDNVYRQWLIRPGSPRTFEELPGGDDVIVFPSRFWPMFAEYPEIRRLVRQQAGLQRLRDDVRERRQ